MPLSPDVLFHRAFQPDRLSSKDRKNYLGRQDLAKLNRPDVESLLLGIQKAYNEDLASVDGYRFYLDYVDSIVENALAFRYEDYSFVGVTMPLVYKLWDICVRLSRSDVVSASLGIESITTSEGYERLHVVLFRLQLNFIVSHEFTHHFFGHRLPFETESIFFNEVMEGTETGSLVAQARELDADGNGAYLVLTNLVDGPARGQATKLLDIESLSTLAQDKILLACFVVAVGAFFFVRPPIAVTKENIDGLTHPPQAARMDRLMGSAIRWCGQNNHAELAAWMTPDVQFKTLMNSMAEAVWGMNGGADWGAQTAFLRSGEGSAYMKRLDAAQKAEPGPTRP